MCFSGTKQGRVAQQKHERVVQSLVEKEYQKYCKSQASSNWSPEEIEAYNKEIRRMIEERVRDSMS